MTTTAYIDESQRSGKYHLCAVLVPTHQTAELRRRTKEIGRGGLLHMRDADRRLQDRFVAEVAALGLPALIATTRGGGRGARDTVLECLALELRARHVASKVIESCDQDRDDRRLLQRVLGPRPPLAYTCQPKGDPLLGLPDVIAWAHPQSSRHRDLFGTSVTIVRPTP